MYRGIGASLLGLLSACSSYPVNSDVTPAQQLYNHVLEHGIPAEQWKRFEWFDGQRTITAEASPDVLQLSITASNAREKNGVRYTDTSVDDVLDKVDSWSWDADFHTTSLSPRDAQRGQEYHSLVDATLRYVSDGGEGRGERKRPFFIFLGKKMF